MLGTATRQLRGLKTNPGAASYYFTSYMPLIVAFFLLSQLLTDGAVDQWLARSNASGVNWYLSDRLGSVTGITDSYGNLLNTTQYDSYGHILSQSNPSVADALGFTGREFDGETGNYYLRARYYNPDLGRFQSEDPIKLNSGDFNIIRYAYNSSSSHRDPYGLSPTIETRTINLKDLGLVQEEGETALAFGRRVHEVIQDLEEYENFAVEKSFPGFGRADLFSEEDQLIVEIKPYNTAGANNGYNQLIRYYAGALNGGFAGGTTEWTLQILLYF